MNRQDAKKRQVRQEPGGEVDDLARATINAALEVHRNLGPGFLERVYEDALCVELEQRRLPFERQVSMEVRYKGYLLSGGRLDLVVGRKLIVELKTVDALLPIHTAQLVAYLRAFGQPLGLLVNFKVPLLSQGVKRVVVSK